MYEWLKAFHLIAVIFWMAGLLYLMKIIMNPAMIVMFILGLILVFGYNAANLTGSIWLPVKLVLVFGLMGYHGFLSKQRKLFAAGERPKSEKFFRAINEIPAILTIIIVIMVIVKPF